jgi:DNA polymerase I
MIFQLLDIDYIFNMNKPVIRMYGRTETGKSICVFYDKFLPYFYIRTTHNPETIQERIKEIKFIEEVYRKTPTGYHKEPTRLLKITILNPQDVPAVKEKLIQERLADEAFESDILFKYRFMIDHGIYGMDWIDADCENVMTKTVRVPAYHARSIDVVKKEKNMALKYLSFDIECIPRDNTGLPDQKKDPIIMISLAFNPEFNGKKNMVLVSKTVCDTEKTSGFVDEKSMLESFLKIMESYDPDILTGYNINAFDIPYILERLKQNKLPQSLGRCSDKPSFNRKFAMSYETTVHGRVVVDPFQIIKRDPWMKFHRYNLNTVARELLNEEKLDVGHAEISKLWNGDMEGMKRLIDYARRDAVLALRLLIERGLLGKFIELSKLCGLLLQDTFGGQTTRIENLVMYEFKKRNYVMPAKPSKQELIKRSRERERAGLKGAIVLEPERGLYSDGCILVMDFKSLYPSIMRTYNISPDTLLLDNKFGTKKHESPTGAHFIEQDIYEGIFPYLLKTLIEARADIKKVMKHSTDEEKRALNAKQLAIKDMSNSFYGYTGYVRARLYMLDVANSITSYGRVNIEKTKVLVEEKFKDVRVVYGDTDSIFVQTGVADLEEARKTGEAIAKHVTSNLSGVLELQFEKIYKTFLILTKKRYAGWRFDRTDTGWKEKMEMRGIETVRRDWCPLVTDVMTDVLNIILKEGDIQKAIGRVKETIEKLRKGEIPLEKLTIIKGITKSIYSYDGMLPHIELARKMAARSPAGTPFVGERIGFVIIKGNQILSKRAEDPDYVKKNRLQIDSDYYIDCQLLPPIERILLSVGIERSEVLGHGRQLSFGDLFGERKRRMKHDIKYSKINNEQEQKPENTVSGCEGFVCSACGKGYRRMPLSGYCDCGGNLLISYHGNVGGKLIL